ncbi:MAG: asparaginase, partial [Thermoprotei archaeon]
MEDSGIFNAGVGSALTLSGRVEMDAAVMDGRDLSIGAVANLRNIKNPILVAEKVLEVTDHILLAGEGAYKFAKMIGFEDAGDLLITAEKNRKREEMIEKWLRGDIYTTFTKLRKLFEE